MKGLFSPITIRGITLKNRIVVSPMCQYSAEDGKANEWHLVHYGGLARGGSSLTIVEDTSVSHDGRITPYDLGLWNDNQKEALRPVIKIIKNAGSVPGIQLGHAGRKGNLNKPWEGNNPISKDDPRYIQNIGPSPIPYVEGVFDSPREMTSDDIQRVKSDFVNAAKRAVDLGFEWINLHFAHGFLATSFFSEHSNKRKDDYGGSFENRSRFLVELVKEVRNVMPSDNVLTARIGIVEFDGNDEKGNAEILTLIKLLTEAGLDSVDASIGFSLANAQVPWGANMIVKYASQIKKEISIPISVSWMISDPVDADNMIKNNEVDMVVLGRPLLQNPHWPYLAAKKLGAEKPSWILPDQYAYWLESYPF